jgi:RNA-directed DNA polymerase
MSREVHVRFSESAGVRFPRATRLVICMQYKDDAERVLKAIEERFTKCGLTLSKEKTRLIEFGRYARERLARRGGKPETFDYLGFTHFCDTTRAGKYKVGRKTSRKKYRQKLKAMNQWLKNVRNMMPLKEWWPMLRKKLEGHFRYYGVSGNSRGIDRYYHEVVRLARKWISRRSQRGRWSWERFGQYLERYPLPRPRIHYNMYTLTYAR